MSTRSGDTCNDIILSCSGLFLGLIELHLYFHAQYKCHACTYTEVSLPLPLKRCANFLEKTDQYHDNYSKRKNIMAIELPPTIE